MQIDKDSVDYLSEARAMRVRYIRGLLSSGWDAVLGFFRSAGSFLKRVKDEKTCASSARTLQIR